jgi:hypothetical protein
MFTKITLYDHQLETVAKKTGLTKLEVLGVIAAINDHAVARIGYSDQYLEDERMGRNVY